MNETHYTPVHPGEVLKDELDEMAHPIHACKTYRSFAKNYQ